MIDKTKARLFERQAKIAKAVAHPLRIAVIDFLQDGEKCVCELRELVGSDMSTVSKHLAVLRDAGIVEDRRDGQNIYYRLRVPCILRFFDCVEAVMREDVRTRGSLGSARR